MPSVCNFNRKKEKATIVVSLEFLLIPSVFKACKHAARQSFLKLLQAFFLSLGDTPTPGIALRLADRVQQSGYGGER